MASRSYLDRVECIRTLATPPASQPLTPPPAVRAPGGSARPESDLGSDGKTRLTFMHSGFDVDNPPYPGWAGWLGGVAALRRYHEVPHWRTIWRQIEAPGVPAGMLSIDV